MPVVEEARPRAAAPPAASGDVGELWLLAVDGSARTRASAVRTHGRACMVRARGGARRRQKPS